MRPAPDAIYLGCIVVPRLKRETRALLPANPESSVGPTLANVAGKRLSPSTAQRRSSFRTFLTKLYYFYVRKRGVSIMKWDLGSIERVFAEAALDPTRWNAAMETAAGATGSRGAAMFPIYGRLVKASA